MVDDIDAPVEKERPKAPTDPADPATSAPPAADAADLPPEPDNAAEANNAPTDPVVDDNAEQTEGLQQEVQQRAAPPRPPQPSAPEQPGASMQVEQQDIGAQIEQLNVMRGKLHEQVELEAKKLEAMKQEVGDLKKEPQPLTKENHDKLEKAEKKVAKQEDKVDDLKKQEAKVDTQLNDVKKAEAATKKDPKVEAKEPKPKNPQKENQAKINSMWKNKTKGKITKAMGKGGITDGKWDAEHAGKAIAEAIMLLIELLKELLKLAARTIQNKRHGGLDRLQRAQKKIEDTHPGLEAQNKQLKGQIEKDQKTLDLGVDPDGKKLSDKDKKELKDSQKENLGKIHKNEKQMAKDKWKEKLAGPKMELEAAKRKCQALCGDAKFTVDSKGGHWGKNNPEFYQAKKDYKAAQAKVVALKIERDHELGVTKSTGQGLVRIQGTLEKQQNDEKSALKKGEYKPIEQMKQTVAEKQDNVNNAQAKLDGAQAKFEDTDKKLKGAEKDVRNADKAFTARQDELDKIDSPTPEQHKELDDLAQAKVKAQEKVDGLKPEHEKLQGEVESARNDLKDARKELDGVKNDLDAVMDAKRDGMSPAEAQIDQAQEAKLDAAQQKIDDYQAKIDEAKDKHEDLIKAHMDGPTEQTEKAVKDNDAHIEGMEAGLDKAKNDQTELKDEIDNQNLSMREDNGKLNDMQAKLDEANEEHDKLLKAHMDGPTDETRAAVELSVKKIGGLEGDIQTAKGELDQKRDELLNPDEQDMGLDNLFKEPGDNMNPDDLTPPGVSQPQGLTSTALTSSGPTPPTPPAQTAVSPTSPTPPTSASTAAGPTQPTLAASTVSAAPTSPGPSNPLTSDQNKSIEDLISNLEIELNAQQDITGTPVAGQGTFQQAGASANVTDNNRDGIDDNAPGQKAVQSHLMEDSDAHDVSDSLEAGKPDSDVQTGPSSLTSMTPQRNDALKDAEEGVSFNNSLTNGLENTVKSPEANEPSSSLSSAANSVKLK